MSVATGALGGGGGLKGATVFKVGVVVVLAAILSLIADRQLRDREGSERIGGVWEAVEYRLASGVVHSLAGRIFFGEGEWQVLFYVLGDGTGGEGGAVRRGSAEGGTYELRGDTIVFTHLFNLSAGDSVPGLPASPLRMTVTPGIDAAEEPTRFSVEGERLTLFFPSGNEMEFVR